MDFLNKSLAQVSELFRSMTPGARITAGLLLAVVVVSIGYLFRQSAAGPDAFLFGGEPLSDGQLTRVEAAIAQAQLPGAQREGNRIRVPAGQQAAYLAAVADAGALPPNFDTILQSALDRGGAWESREATRERLKIARQQTLSEIVRAMSWVDDAVVLYDEQESRQPGRLSLTKQVTASVSVKPIVGEALDPMRAKNLQKMVASAVNMDPSKVNITNLGDGGTYGTDGTAVLGLLDDEYLKAKVTFEMQKKDSILNALRDIPGIRVEVNAELDAAVEQTQRTVKPDKVSATPSRTVSVTEESDQTTSKAGGQPGTVAQGPTRQGATANPQQNTNKTKSGTEEISSVVGVDENTVLKKGYTPKEVRASIAVPSSYIENVWKEHNKTATAPPKPEDLTTIKKEVVTNVEEIVEPLLVLEANLGRDNYKHVKVVVLDSLAPPAIVPQSVSTKAASWAGRYWSTLAMLGVAMFSLLVLRSVVKSIPGDGATPAAAGPALTLHADEPTDRSEAAADEPADDRPRLRLKKGKSLKDDLVQIVHEDPDAAADILRAWIGKAG